MYAQREASQVSMLTGRVLAVLPPFEVGSSRVSSIFTCWLSSVLFEHKGMNFPFHMEMWQPIQCSRFCTEFKLIGPLCIVPVMLGTTFALIVNRLPSFTVISTFVVDVQYFWGFLDPKVTSERSVKFPILRFSALARDSVIYVLWLPASKSIRTVGFRSSVGSFTSVFAVCISPEDISTFSIVSTSCCTVSLSSCTVLPDVSSTFSVVSIASSSTK